MKIDARVRLALGFLLVPFVLLVVLLVALFGYGSKSEKWQLAQLQNGIGALPHPSGSTFVARHGFIGLFGNGHHTDFWAVELRSFSGSRAALQKSYEEVRVPVPNADDEDYSGVKNGTQPVKIKFLPSPLPENYTVQVANLVDDSQGWKLTGFSGKRGLYVVQVLNQG